MADRTVAPGTPGSVIGPLLAELEATLAGAGVALARDEARDLIAAVLDVSRFWPVVHGDAELEPPAIEAARTAARRRASGAPFAYAVGRASFRHLTLRVDERVLIPRQETEELVEIVLGQRRGGIAVDVGTGSGAIAIALATEGWYGRVLATDISTDALAVAALNVRQYNGVSRAAIELLAGSFLAPVGDLGVDVVVANLPYISYDEAAALPASVRDWEPPVALFSADVGMRAIRAVIRQSADTLRAGGLLALELDSRRASLAAELAATDGRFRDVVVRLDLAGRERFLLATRGDG